ncbi:MAG: sigma-54-dependent Fis family transcriptional regulator [Deltaproteobacteria bacterium]|nr:sigma-54-dependent Fis family transcriptional regulator [Deltaproteobacteria bacterium]
MTQVPPRANSAAPILITGETGTGKAQIARCLHTLGDRRDAMFVKVNCPALTPTLFESELFGHAKGAFTGANAQRIGRFEMADGGTIFLDEIGELEPNLQAKLLNVLQDRVIERVGDNRPIKVDFRLIAATNKDLSVSIKEKAFRLDLFYRLNTYSLHIPPLRERVEDIPFLIEQLTAEQAVKTNRRKPTYSSSCMELMSRYSWPGNVRELKNVIKRLVLMAPGDFITSLDFEAIVGRLRNEPLSGRLTLAELEREHILRTLAQTKGAVGGPNGAAAILGLPRQTLQYRMKKYGLTPFSWMEYFKK